MYLKPSFLSCSWSGQVYKTSSKPAWLSTLQVVLVTPIGVVLILMLCSCLRSSSSSSFHKSELRNILQISQPQKRRLWTSQQPHGELIIYREAMIPSWNFKSQIRIVSILQSKRSVSQERGRKRDSIRDNEAALLPLCQSSNHRPTQLSYKALGAWSLL